MNPLLRLAIAYLLLLPVLALLLWAVVRGVLMGVGILPDARGWKRILTEWGATTLAVWIYFAWTGIRR